jgi:hypothetical protein
MRPPRVLETFATFCERELVMVLFPKKIDLDTSLDAGEWLDCGIMVAVLLACGVALSLNVADPDLWGHVQYGRDALAHGLARTTTYSYVAEGYPWINHEIIAEYALALGDRWLGGSGLLVIKCLLGLSICSLILLRARQQGAALIASCALTLLVAVTLGSHWSLRPQLISYGCFTALLALLTWCFAGWEGTWQLSLCRGIFRGGSCQPPQNGQSLGADAGSVGHERQALTYNLRRLKFLWLAVPLFAFWTNSHGGFLAGLCVFLAYLGLRSIEAISRKGRAADGLVVRFALMGAAAIAATFLNPYGPRFHIWLYHDLAVPRPEITEWRSPEFFNTQFLPFWLLLAAAVASLWATRQPRDFTQLIILGLIAWQSLSHHRHIAFFALTCGWWLPRHFDSFLARLGIGQRMKSNEEILYGWAPPEGGAFCATIPPHIQQVMAGLLVLAVCISTGQLARRLTLLKVERDIYPVSAVDFVARHGLTGKMVCTFNWAQYALAALGSHEADQPGIQVQIDGRCRTSFSQAMLDAHFDFLLGDVGPDQRYRDPRTGPFDATRVLREGEPDLVLISRLQRPSVEVMESQRGEWTLLYQDSLAQLWGRSARYDDRHSPFYLPRNERDISDAPQHGFVHWPALPACQKKTARHEAPASASRNRISDSPRR